MKIVRVMIVFVFFCSCQCLAYPPLFRAISQANFNEVKKIIQDFHKDEIELNDYTIVKKVVNERDFYGRTPLIYTIIQLGMTNTDQEKLKYILSYLILNGADVNRTYKNGLQRLTPLYWASNINNKHLLSFLIDQGADINKLNVTNLGQDYTILMFRASGVDNDNSWIELLLKNDASIDQQNNDGETALMIAARRDNIENVKQLKCSGASLTIENNFGQTAYEIALQNNNDEIAKILQTSVMNLCDL